MANISISGGTSPTVAVYGKNFVVTAGLGTDSVGSTTVGATGALGKLVSVSVGAPILGNDTINVGSGLDTVVQSGQASVTSAFSSVLGTSSVTGGGLSTTLTNTTGTLSGLSSATGGEVATVIGGALQTVGVTASNALTDVQGVSQGPPAILAATLNNAGIDVQTLVSNTTQTAGVTLGNTLETAQGTSQSGVAEVNGVFSSLKSVIHATVGSSGADTLSGGASHVSNFLSSGAVAESAITNFVSANPMSVDGYSLSYLQSHHDISSQGGNTYISVDGGKSSIELKGIGGLTSSESVLHKS